MYKTPRTAISKVLDSGVDLYRQHWRDSYVWALLISIVALGLPMLPNIDSLPLTIITGLLLFVLLSWLYLCLFFQLEADIRQKYLSMYEIVLHAAARVPTMLLGTIFYVLSVGLSAAPLILLVFYQNAFFAMLVFLLVIGLSFWTSLSLCFFPAAIVSQNLGPLPALAQSWNLMRQMRDWFRATVAISIGFVMVALLRILPILAVTTLFALSQKLLGQTFEMQMLQDPFVHFTWGYVGILLLVQAALTAVFLPLATAIYLKQYHVLLGNVD